MLIGDEAVEIKEAKREERPSSAGQHVQHGDKYEHLGKNVKRYI